MCYYLNMLNPETELIALAEATVNERAPAGWSVRASLSPSRAIDAILKVTSPTNETVEFGLEVKRLLTPAQVPEIDERFNKYKQKDGFRQGLVVAQYLSPSTRQSLTDAGLSYIDLAGNVSITSSSPAFFIFEKGLDKDPLRKPGRPKATLTGEPAARVVRTFLDYKKPWRIRDLMESSGASTGSVYRVVEYLESEAIVARDFRNQLVLADWQKLLRRWAEDYSFIETNEPSLWIAPRGIETLPALLAQTEPSEYCVTGSLAATTWAAYAPTRLVSLYAANPTELANQLGLRQTDAGANVLIAKPAFSVLTERTIVRNDGIRIAAAAQVAIDLLNGPGRAPAEAEHLLEWMGAHVDAWRI